MWKKRWHDSEFLDPCDNGYDNPQKSEEGIQVQNNIIVFLFINMSHENDIGQKNKTNLSF